VILMKRKAFQTRLCRFQRQGVGTTSRILPL
jgi:hypothetical protein